MSKRSKNKSKRRGIKQYVYIIRNKINEDMYIGITYDFNKRMKSHKRRSIAGETKLYNSIRKYGWKNFEKEIIEVVYCRTEVFELEKFYIEEFDTFHNGLNSTPGGDGSGCRGDNARAIKVKSHNIKTGEERIFDCISDAADELDLNSSIISGVINGRYTYSGEYMFQQYDPNNPNNTFDSSNILTRYERTKKAGLSTREVTKIPIIGTHFTGFTIEFEAISDAGRILNISTGKISACARGNIEFTKGYTWEYKDEEMRSMYPKFIRQQSGAKSSGKVYRILEDGTKDIYNSGNEAEKKLNIKSCIIPAIKRGTKADGYVWRYLDDEQQSKYPDPKPRVIYPNKGPVYRILEDGTKDEYTSAGEAERKTGIKHVRRAADTGMKAGGYRWYAV
ncbi:homing endonuclease [Paramecium bursaria Chlorella virus NY2A]|uniref:Uncharacterized protein B850L n=1 Tax=Paramecium bursaria Chlorella virus NY2A TaxID=46021 RepID=A7IY25_PBCVN|nr:homing endonuclease [Paramecium bursaria Chlorella virus NY2A]ABT15249.1 hypothetical protein NY2A_B850L [Paramecium bursaria Chlorella virus NY2A]